MSHNKVGCLPASLLGKSTLSRKAQFARLSISENVLYYLQQQELRETKARLAFLEIKVFNMEKQGKQEIVQELIQIRSEAALERKLATKV